MKMLSHLIALTVLSVIFGCSSNGKRDLEGSTPSVVAGSSNDPAELVSSPLRNRIRLELNSPVEQVWAVVGDLSKMPQYSVGLESVEAKYDEMGFCTGYICHFKPMGPGDNGIEHKAIMKWYEPLKGWASVDEEPNAFGLSESLTKVSLSQANEKTILQWDMHYNASDLEMNKASLNQALADISGRLVERFGGKVTENFVEGNNGDAVN
jgi:hypothetical protein